MAKGAGVSAEEVVTDIRRNDLTGVGTSWGLGRSIGHKGHEIGNSRRFRACSGPQTPPSNLGVGGSNPSRRAIDNARRRKDLRRLFCL